ncbi:MAG TPA: hypothetical protein VKG45_12790, partial [Actinomycetes bacterium]|nr:hypothetical protein [Actinomycetes bacterium]
PHPAADGTGGNASTQPQRLSEADVPQAQEDSRGSSEPSGTVLQAKGETPAPQPAPAVQIADVRDLGDTPADADASGAVLVADASADIFSNDFRTWS